jgi:hypothetical protein
VQRTRARTIERPTTTKKKEKAKAAKRRTAKPTARKRVRSLPTATERSSSSPDSTLLIGGLALVVLVLGDTILLAASSRYLRPS